MTTLLTILCLSLGLSIVLTPLARTVARRYGLVDKPDGRRKIHSEAIPVAGGIAILLAGTGALVAAIIGSPLRDRLLEHTSSLVGLLLGSFVICLVGIVDDFRGLRGRHKFLGQMIAVGVVMASGVWVGRVELFNHGLDLGLLALPFTIFWLLGAINSLNLMDGMDGMLSCAALIISLAMALMAVMGQHWGMACVAMALCGSLLGFLRYNFPPASIFLGDSGSMLVGLVVGVLAIHTSPGGPTTLALAAPIAVLTLPIFDTTAAIIRRKLTGRSIYTTDRGHLHHCLLRSGLSTRRVLLWVSFFCFLTLVGALASKLFHNELFAILTAAIVVGILVFNRIFGYAEFLLVQNQFGSLASLLWGRRKNGTTSQVEIRLQGSADWTTLWRSLTRCAIDLQLRTLRLDVNAPAVHEGYHARWDRVEHGADERGLWRAEIPLTAAGQYVGRIEISGSRDAISPWEKIATLSKLVENLEFPLAPTADMPARTVITAAPSDDRVTSGAAAAPTPLPSETSCAVALEDPATTSGSAHDQLDEPVHLVEEPAAARIPALKRKAK
jgi:UDP-GlcNAc:undecaprenyl-phosphate GlcNAc-1-phosphate transferase